MRDEDFAWLVEHGPELFRKYSGKWIAVRDGQVIGVGDTAPEAAQQAREKADDADFILEAVDAEADVIYGYLSSGANARPSTSGKFGCPSRRSIFNATTERFKHLLYKLTRER